MLTVDVKEIKEAVKQMKKVGFSKMANPVYRYIRIEDQQMLGTDLDLWKTIGLETATNDSTTTFFLELQAFDKILKTVPKSQKVLKIEKVARGEYEYIIFHLDDGNVEIPTDPDIAEDYAVPFQEASVWETVLPYPVVENALKNALVFTADERYRYSLDAVLFEVKDGVLRIEGANGNMLYLHSMPVSAPDCEVLLNKQHIKNILGVKAETLTVAVGGDDPATVSLTAGPVSVWCRSLEMRYPEIGTILNRPEPIAELALDKRFIPILKRALVLNDNVFPHALLHLSEQVKISFEASGNPETTLYTPYTSTGQARRMIDLSQFLQAMTCLGDCTMNVVETPHLPCEFVSGDTRIFIMPIVTDEEIEAWNEKQKELAEAAV